MTSTTIAADLRIYETYHLHVTNDKMYIEPLDADVNEVLVIDRVTQETSFQIPGILPAPGAAEVLCGFLFSRISADFLALVPDSF